MNAACPSAFIRLFGQEKGGWLFEKMLAGEYLRTSMAGEAAPLMNHDEFSELVNTRRLTVADLNMQKQFRFYALVWKNQALIKKELGMAIWLSVMSEASHLYARREKVSHVAVALSYCP